jgi:glycosyltransferase involved in cell wall biosynthesis
MRLAYLSTDPGIGYGGTKGASVHVEELVGALAAAGAEVLLIVAWCAPEASPPDGVTLEILPGPGKGAPAGDRLAAEPERAAWLEERVGRFAPDVLYERLALQSASGSVAARALQIPHVVELNAPLLVEAERYRRLDFRADSDRLERAVLTDAELVVAVSRPLARYARRRGAERVEVVANAVALERFGHGRPRDGRPPVAVFAGSLRPWHGVETIAEAWALLGRDAPQLLVVGDGPGRPLLEAAGAHVTGAVPHADVPALLACTDIGLAPYALDAPDYFSPLKLFEYLAAGLATIAADLPGVRDIVSSETAVIVPAGDERALAGAVASLAGDAERRERLGRAGRAVVAARHTWTHRALRILALTAGVAGEPVRRTIRASPGVEV